MTGQSSSKPAGSISHQGVVSPLSVLLVFLVWSFTVYYNLAAFSGGVVVASASLGISVIVTCYFVLFKIRMLEASFFLACLHLVLPMISHPSDLVLSSTGMLGEEWMMSSDRIQARTVVTSVAGLAYIAKFFFISIRRKKLTSVSAALFCVVLVSIIASADYVDLSRYQAAVDGIYFASAICCAFYFRSLDKIWTVELLRIGYQYTRITFLLLGGILLVDIVLSSSGFISWSKSYRDGLQGSFYGFELPFALVCGLTATYLCNVSSKRTILFILTLLSSTAVIWLTNIKSAVGALVLAALIPLLMNSKITYKVAKVVLLCLPFGAYLFMSSIEGDSSLLVRLGTYASFGFSFMSDQNWLLGIQPGVVDFTMVSNLAAAHFSSGYEAQLISLADNVAGELRERADYEQGGAFLPHNAWLCIIFAYGLLSFPVLYYYLFLPGQFLLVSEYRRLVCNDAVLWLIIFICVFAVLHPVILLFNLICLVELLRGKVTMFKELGRVRV